MGGRGRHGNSATVKFDRCSCKMYFSARLLASRNTGNCAQGTDDTGTEQTRPSETSAEQDMHAGR